MLKTFRKELIRKPKAVIFDTDNTLYPDEIAHIAAIDAVKEKAKNILGISKKKFEIAYQLSRKNIKENLGLTASSHSRLLYFQGAIEFLGLRTRILLTLDLEQTYWRTFLANTRLFPEVLEFLQILKSNKIKTANITDLTAQIQFRKMVYFGLEEFFDYVVTSEEAGADKPNPKPFNLALDKLTVDPSEVWMIGDNCITDIKGGNAVGLLTFQKIHKGVSTDRNETTKPDFMFDNYRDLIDFYRVID